MDLNKVQKSLEKEKKRVEKALAKTVRDKAAYLATMLRNFPVRTKAQNPDKMRSAGENYVALSKENLVWLPDPNGGKPQTDGTTVKEFLKKIRATGTTETRKFQTQRYSGKYKRNRNRFARTPDGKRIWETKTYGETYEKRSKRTSQKERDYIAKLKADERKLRRKLKAKDTQRLGKLKRDILRLEREANRKKPRKGAAVRLSQKREKFLAKKEKLAQERQQKILQKRKPKHYRIVGEIQKPREQTFLRKVRPDTVRTWYGDGGPEKFLGRNWKVTKVSDLEIHVSCHPLGGKNSNFLRNIEYGGTFDPKPVLNGYIVIFEDTGKKGQQWNQRRVRFLPHVEDSSPARVKARHFVSQTVERFNKKNGKQLSYTV